MLYIDRYYLAFDVLRSLDIIESRYSYYDNIPITRKLWAQYAFV